MLGVFAAVAALCGAFAPWALLPLVAAVCWGCYDGLAVQRDGAVGWLTGPDLRALALLCAFTLLGRLLSGPVERAATWRSEAARAAVEANPLFRPDDRRRARLERSRSRLAATALGLGLAVGLAVHAHSDAAAAEAAGHTHAVTATTLASGMSRAVSRSTARDEAVALVSVPAAWEYPAGSRHTGRVVVLRHQAAGTRVSVWVDDAGRPAVRPSSATDRGVFAGLVGLTAFAGAEAFALGGCRVLRTRLDRRASRAWAKDWARVEPHWSGRHRNEDVGGR
ncbi:Rv1733c family protein [Streptacidiphilus anmyonensis]|uniref:Rv1733c family protein n=1 Tax=Streptacidiphilus anmyonensis TaxID=405782 RepID=UPI000693D97A|nr:hypothetical protein [Streptacidiphilus anmyonensis]